MKKHGSKVVNMLYTQWNWDDAMAVEREEAYEDGRAEGRVEGRAEGRAEGRTEGRAEGRVEGRTEGEAIGKARGDLQRRRQDILDLLEDLGEIPQDIHSRILAEEDTETLRRWLKAAARAESFADFRENMNSRRK